MSTCMVYPSKPEYVYATVEADLQVEEPSVSKYVHVENITKIKIKFNKGAYCWFTLYDYITMHGIKT